MLAEGMLIADGYKRLRPSWKWFIENQFPAKLKRNNIIKREQSVAG